MKEAIYTIIFLGVVVATGWFLAEKNKLSQNSSFSEVLDNSSSDTLLKASNSGVIEKKQTESTAAVDEKKFQSPLDRVNERVTKKPFGIFITPANSSVQPEKFSGYHTGVDFEIFPEELDVEVIVKAVCSGRLLMKRNAAGYGGVVVQSCDLDGEPIIVVYGHLKLENTKVAVGDDIGVGETLGALGRAYSTETSGERKHLHLGMHKGQEINILGYVSPKSALSNWLDPMSLMK